MKTHIGINDKTRIEVGQMLNLLLADECLLATTTRDYHWNVTGPDFVSLHRLFDEQYSQSARAIDELAERARAIGAGVRGSWVALTKSTRTTAEVGTNLPAQTMLFELLALHEDLIIQLRADIYACAEQFHDSGSADFLTDLMRQHEKTAWTLRAQLASEEEEATQDQSTVNIPSLL